MLNQTSTVEGFRAKLAKRNSDGLRIGQFGLGSEPKGVAIGQFFKERGTCPRSSITGNRPGPTPTISKNEVKFETRKLTKEQDNSQKQREEVVTASLVQLVIAVKEKFLGGSHEPHIATWADFRPKQFNLIKITRYQVVGNPKSYHMRI
ncbi:hypothetical protein EVAR_53806_1 [Eumeta japonica]|uniref:Uncharacterized protein n=1 Tax=Eumeta variegata TaxID=151549 RepID=A0A4C1XXC0_EUMVA|nr:hypothetical protein EVAR_53806_1 [Eumeta japonica]